MYSIFKATVGHKSEIKNRARRMSWADDGDSCEDFITTSCRVQTPQYVTADEFAALTDQVKTLITVGKLQLQFENFQYTYEEHQQTRETTQLPLLLERMQNHYQVLPSPTCSQSPSPNCGVDSLCFKYGEPGYLRIPAWNQQLHITIVTKSQTNSYGQKVQKSRSPTAGATN